MIEEAVRAHLKGMIGARPFLIRAAPFRRWELRLFTLDKQGFIDLELAASQVNLQPKAFKRHVLDPALEQLKERYRTAA